MNDRLSDFATRLRNAYLVGKTEILVPHTKLLESVAAVLLDKHYLAGFTVEGELPHKQLRLNLVYADRQPALNHIKRISKPGVRIYQPSRALFPVLNGLGIQIVSTSKGVMTGQDARTDKLGGEVLLELW